MHENSKYILDIGKQSQMIHYSNIECGLEYELTKESDLEYHS